MALRVTVGQAQSIDPREAGAHAARQAVEGLGRAPVLFGWVMAHHLYSLPQVVAGVTSIVGQTPLLGLSTTGEATSEGWSQRTVVVALMGGDGLTAKAEWSAGFGEDSQASVQRLAQNLEIQTQPEGVMMAVADGLNGDPSTLLSLSGSSNIPFVGCLASGDLQSGRTFQIGGMQAGSGGLALAMLSGSVKAGIGSGHGWQAVGANYRLTRVQGRWIRTLDGQRASEVYTNLFGFSEKQWGLPPLNEMVRMYPFGIDMDRRLVVHSPLRMEADGSLRMNISVDEEKIVYLMVGSPEECVKAARLAAQDAIKQLEGAKPVFAWLLADVAWQTLFQTRMGEEIAAIRQELGEDVPIAGGYTLGQLAPAAPGAPVEVLNQHLVLMVLAETLPQV